MLIEKIYQIGDIKNIHNMIAVFVSGITWIWLWTPSVEIIYKKSYVEPVDFSIGVGVAAGK